VNAANARIFELALAGLEGWVMALDGMPLEAPQPVSDTVLLGPGQRRHG
jgi:FtsP/CotA-like multicopper oxidase with cupredoxin domain